MISSHYTVFDWQMIYFLPQAPTQLLETLQLYSSRLIVSHQVWHSTACLSPWGRTCLHICLVYSTNGRVHCYSTCRWTSTQAKDTPLFQAIIFHLQIFHFIFRLVMITLICSITQSWLWGILLHLELCTVTNPHQSNSLHTGAHLTLLCVGTQIIQLGGMVECALDMQTAPTQTLLLKLSAAIMHGHQILDRAAAQAISGTLTMEPHGMRYQWQHYANMPTQLIFCEKNLPHYPGKSHT